MSQFNYVLFGLFFLASVSAFASSTTAHQRCKLAYGSSPFAALTFEYDVVGRNAAQWPQVDLHVAFERTTLEEGVEYQPIVAKNVSLADVINRDVTLSVESIGDYAAGTITFERDDALSGPLAVLRYVSDGMDGFAVYECASFPEL